MMRRETPFVTRAELIFVRGRVIGPHGIATVRLVFDTGAAYTTITPEIATNVGHNPRDGARRTHVHTAVGIEQGYLLAVAKLSVLGLAVQQFPVHVFDLGYDDIDGLVGLNLLSQLNYEVRSVERRILVELARPSS